MIDADYAQACQNKTTDERAEDEKCSEEGRSSGHYGWYFLPMGSSGSSSSRALPAVGARLAGGVTSILPKQQPRAASLARVQHPFPAAAFGGSAKGGSTGG